MTDASHRRWDGRRAVIENTVWQLELRGQRFRCVRRAANSFVIQMHEKIWRDTADGKSARELLFRLLGANSVERVLASIDAP